MTEPSTVQQANGYDPDLRPPSLGVALLVLLALIAIGGGGYAAYNGLRAPEVTIDPREQKARVYIADLTRDPTATQFRAITSDDHCVTGEVNAKNAFGTYVGYQRFFYSPIENFGSIDESQEVPTAQGSNEALNALSEHMDFVLQKSQCIFGHPIKR